MIDSKIEKRFLNWLFDDYCDRYGYGIRNIDYCPFYTTYSCKHLPVEFFEVNDGISKSHVIQYAKELQAKGLLRFDENGYQFYFTEELFKISAEPLFLLKSEKPKRNVQKAST